MAIPQPEPPTQWSVLGPRPGRQAQAELVRRHQTGVWRYLRMLGCADDLADDLTQDVFVVAFRRGLEDEGRERTAAFLRRTARFLWLRHERDHRRRAEKLADATDGLWDREWSEDDGQAWIDALRSCVEQLAARPRRVVAMFYGEQRSRAEIAGRLGMKENGVKTLLHRTRELLRDCVRRKMT